MKICVIYIGAVDALLIKAQNVFVQSGGDAGPDGFDVLTTDHFPVPVTTRSASEMLANMINAEEIQKFFANLKTSVLMAKRRDQNQKKEFNPASFLEGYTLVGPPG